MDSAIQKIWLDGELKNAADATVHVLNHSLHYGSAVFEGIRCYMTPTGPAIFRLEDHVNRLFHSAEVMGMQPPYSRAEITQAIVSVVAQNKLSECYIRPIFFYGDKMGLLPIGAPLHCAIAAWPWAKYLKKDAVSVKVSPYIRIHPRSSEMTAKISGHYSNSIIASLDAHKSGFDEALFLDTNDNVAEGPGENIFFVSDRSLVTPESGSILSGLTRDSIIRIAADRGYAVTQRAVSVKELSKFSEAFFVGTAVEVNAIANIDTHIFNDGKVGPVAAEIKAAYTAAIHGEDARYMSWLHPVKE